MIYWCEAYGGDADIDVSLCKFVGPFGAGKIRCAVGNPIEEAGHLVWCLQRDLQSVRFCVKHVRRLRRDLTIDLRKVVWRQTVRACESLFVDSIAKLWGQVEESEWSRLTQRPDRRWKKEFKWWWRVLVVSAIFGLRVDHGNVRHCCASCEEKRSVGSKHEHDVVFGA